MRSKAGGDDKSIVHLKIHEVVQDMDFRYSPQSLFLAYAAQNPDRLGAMKPDDALLFISKSRKRGCFVPGTVANQSYVDVVDGKFMALAFTCPRGFSWLMLGNYAAEIGVKLVGVRSFESHMADILNGLVEVLDVRPMSLKDIHKTAIKASKPKPKAAKKASASKTPAPKAARRAKF